MPLLILLCETDYAAMPLFILLHEAEFGGIPLQIEKNQKKKTQKRLRIFPSCLNPKDPELPHLTGSPFLSGHMPAK